MVYRIVTGNEERAQRARSCLAILNYAAESSGIAAAPRWRFGHKHPCSSQWMSRHEGALGQTEQPVQQDPA